MTMQMVAYPSIDISSIFAAFLIGRYNAVRSFRNWYMSKGSKFFYVYVSVFVYCFSHKYHGVCTI